jgi:hypothetical protein
MRRIVAGCLKFRLSSKVDCNGARHEETWLKRNVINSMC